MRSNQTFPCSWILVIEYSVMFSRFSSWPPGVNSLLKFRENSITLVRSVVTEIKHDELEYVASLLSEISKVFKRIFSYFWLIKWAVRGRDANLATMLWTYSTILHIFTGFTKWFRQIRLHFSIILSCKYHKCYFFWIFPSPEHPQCDSADHKNPFPQIVARQ